MVGMFQKQGRLSGREKAALLLASLGPTHTKELEKQFSTGELKKLRTALKKTKIDRFQGDYNNRREMKVLEEVVRYGVNKRFIKVTGDLLSKDEWAVTHAPPTIQDAREASVIELVKKNEEGAAAIIKMWLS